MNFDYKAVNFIVQTRIAEEYAQFVREEFIDVMRQRGHKIEICGDEIMVEAV